MGAEITEQGAKATRPSDTGSRGADEHRKTTEIESVQPSGPRSWLRTCWHSCWTGQRPLILRRSWQEKQAGLSPSTKTLRPKSEAGVSGSGASSNPSLTSSSFHKVCQRSAGINLEPVIKTDGFNAWRELAFWFQARSTNDSLSLLTMIMKP